MSSIPVSFRMENELVARLDDSAAALDRDRSWVIRKAIEAWLDQKQSRYDMTMEALAQVDQGEVLSLDVVRKRSAKRRASRS